LGNQPKTVVTKLTPKFFGEYARRFDSLCKDLDKDKSSRDIRITEELKWVSQRQVNAIDNQRYRTAILILADLLNLSWQLRYLPTGLELIAQPVTRSNGLEESEIQEVKSQLREQLGQSVRTQLEHPATREFLRRMETPNQQAKHKSIRTLIADGHELESRLSNITTLPKDQRSTALAKAIRPYLQLVNPDEKDEYSGIRLGEIWRYFRHTWSIPNLSIPGRQLLYLIRDAGHPNHTIIGIAALSNSAMQLADRDDFIGWTTTSFTNRFVDIVRNGDRDGAEYLLNLIEKYIQAGIEELDTTGLVESHELEQPSEMVVNRLKSQVLQYARERHKELRETRTHVVEEEPLELPYEWADLESEEILPDVDAEILALDIRATERRIGGAQKMLFLKKRAYELSRLLAARLVFQTLRKANDLLEAIGTAIRREEVQVALNSAIVAHKKSKIGTNMLEITTCGAIAPYNYLLGGKLVALLMLSTQILRDYQTRYGSRPSLIASQLANKEVIRPCELVSLGTTSLYGIGSSQYNRLSLPASILHPDQPEIRYREIGKTSGFGTVQFSLETSRALGEMEENERGFQDINHIFGEGFSPKLRKIRAGLSNLGFDSNVILLHNQPRLLYSIELCAEAKPFLRGECHELPDYITAPTSVEDTTERIAEYWRERWLQKRLENTRVLQKVKDYEFLSLISKNHTVTTPLQLEIPNEVADMSVKIPEPRIAGVSLEFLQKLYRDTSAYSDRLSANQRGAIDISTPLGDYVRETVRQGHSVILTGNAGDGKTHILSTLSEDLLRLGAHIILDASAIPPEQIVVEWKQAIAEGKPFCLAANEWPLFRLVQEYLNELPILESVQFQLDNQLVYSLDKDFSSDIQVAGLIVIDLGKRNHLHQQFFETALTAILKEELYEQCQRCPVYRDCDTTKNRSLLKHDRVKTRLTQLVARLVLMGHHVTVRELLATLSYMIFGGRTCSTLARESGKQGGYYSDQLFNNTGRGELLELIRKTIDPSLISHPTWDVALSYGGLNIADWLDPHTIPPVYGDNRNPNLVKTHIEQFNHVKRRFYFEHEQGDALLSMIPEDERVFSDWCNPDTDLDTVLEEILDYINWFFCPVLNESDRREKLWVWTWHHYDERAPKAFVCRHRLNKGDYLELRRPQLAPHLLKAFAYHPDHLRLIVKSNNTKQQVFLNLDFTLFKTLREVKRGLPPMLVPEEQIVRLYQFMNAIQTMSLGQSLSERQEVWSYIVGAKNIIQATVRRKRIALLKKSL